MSEKIVSSIADGMVERNLLKTDFLKLLQNAFKTVVILTSSEEFYAYLQKQYQSTGVKIHFEPYTVKKTDAFFNYVFRNSISTATVYEEQWSAFRGINGKKKISVVIFSFYRVCFFLGKFSIWRSFLRFAYKYFTIDRYAKEYLQKENPDIVFAPSITLADYKLVQSAKELGIPVVQMIKSWDNLTSKTFLGCLPDRLVTHNEIMKREAVHYSDMPEQRIFVSGIPQFDYLYSSAQELKTDRDIFYKSLGINPDKKIILFSLTGGALSPHEKDFLKMINDAIKEGRLSENVHVHVRLHPKNESNLNGVEALQHITLQKPFTYLSGPEPYWVFEKKDMEQWFNSLIHSSVVINMASTMAIDAAYFDKPVICLGFDGYNTFPFKQSSARFYKRTHYQNVVRTNAVKIVYSEKELIDSIKECLENPDKKRNERKTLVTEQCYKIDGHASERIVHFLANLEV